MGQADPPYVKVKKSFFEWRNKKHVKDSTDTSAMAVFYDDVHNRMKFFNPPGGTADLEDAPTWFPKMPMIPAEVAFIIASTPTTPWELHQHLCDYENERDATVVAMLAPVKAWTLVASCTTANKDGSVMALTFPPVTMVSTALRKRLKLKVRLNTTLGTRLLQPPTPVCSQPTRFADMSPQQVATTAVASMTAAQPNAASVGDIFQ